MGMSGLLDVVFPGCASFESGLLIAKRERVIATCAACGVEWQCVVLGSLVDSHRLKHRFDLTHMASGKYPYEQGRGISGAARGNVGSWRSMRTRSTMPFWRCYG
jgi:hypothetical protein